ncbi:gamma-butyrobetaine hydroxylase-like domain-containing protein [Colwellia sp. TT2012]|uniref:gamma-butyrobetaine hydroxylase-like domain-containing protein n=1 Tax=Colwellia sp. TT2012 TaxID=1720342 RepID=UPI0007092BAD|nr:gamma-butyrobetaine hydroxylase-like domain-containing protein [Colwellia sp. TT2012]
MNITHFIIDNNQHNLAIEFAASQTIESALLSFEYLRISSPASSAKKLKTGPAAITSHKKAVRLIKIESVAKHGYRLIFDDGHNAIYSGHYIQILAVEYDVRWQHYLTELKASGHSREAMIDIKQL